MFHIKAQKWRSSLKQFNSISYLFGKMAILERKKKELNLVGVLEKMMVDLLVEHGTEKVQEVLLAEKGWEMKPQE